MCNTQNSLLLNFVSVLRSSIVFGGLAPVNYEFNL